MKIIIQIASITMPAPKTKPNNEYKSVELSALARSGSTGSSDAFAFVLGKIPFAKFSKLFT